MSDQSNSTVDSLSRVDTLGVMASAPTPGAQSESVNEAPVQKQRVKWDRSPVSREDLARLNRRSDLLGFAQTLGLLAVLALGSGLAIYSFFRWPWYVTVLLVFLNGHSWHFLINGFHELIHDSVFKTRKLNRFFLRLFSFLGWYNHHHFWASHTEHHKFAMFPPQDLKAVQPEYFPKEALVKTGIVDLRRPVVTIRDHLRTALGKIDPNDPWANALFPGSEPARRKNYFNWARMVASIGVDPGFLEQPGRCTGLLILICDGLLVLLRGTDTKVACRQRQWRRHGRLDQRTSVQLLEAHDYKRLFSDLQQ